MMADPPPPPYKAGCEGKHRYPDKRAAVGAMNQLARGRTAGDVKRHGLHVYPCDHCAGWHLAKGGHADHRAIERKETRAARGDVKRTERRNLQELRRRAGRWE